MLCVEISMLDFDLDFVVHILKFRVVCCDSEDDIMWCEVEVGVF